MTQDQAVQLLDHASGRLAPQHRPLALVRLQLVDRQLLLPAFVVQHDQRLGRVGFGVQERRQQTVDLARAGAIGVVEGVLDDPDRDAVPVGIPILGRGVELGQERAVG